MLKATTKTFLSFLCMSLLSLRFDVNGEDTLSIDIGDMRFIVTEEQGNWYQANHACSVLGMSLASIESDTEYKSLRNYLNKNDLLGESFWLSGTNLPATYTWLTTGNKVKYTKWKDAEPVAGTDRCIYASGPQFLWSTDACIAKKYIICSRALIPNCGITGRCKRNKSFFH